MSLRRRHGRHRGGAGAHEVAGGEMGFWDRATYNFLHNVCRVLALFYFRAYARNVSVMPRSGRVIVSPAHRSNLDVPLLGTTSPRRLRYMAKGSLFDKRVWAWFLTVLGGFPLDREAVADRVALEAAVRVLEGDEPLVVFPEGERKSGPTIYPVADGAAWLAARTGAPVLPVGIGGTQRAMPKGALVPRPRRLVFIYGELMYPPRPEPGRRRASRSQLRAFSEELREVLQDLFDRAQEMAGSPNPPPEMRPPLPT